MGRLANGGNYKSRSKLLNRKYHFVKECMKDNDIVAASRCRREDVFSDKKLGEFTTHVAPVLSNCEGQSFYSA